jgi:hypothetical protein
MEYFIVGYEYARSLWTGKFRYEHVSRQCISINVLYSKFFQSLAAKYNTHFHLEQINYSTEEIEIPLISNPTIIGSGMISIVFEGYLDNNLVIVKTKRKGQINNFSPIVIRCCLNYSSSGKREIRIVNDRRNRVIIGLFYGVVIGLQLCTITWITDRVWVWNRNLNKRCSLAKQLGRINKYA